MDCVIKIIKGPEEGREFRLSGGETIIGRSLKAQVHLSSEKVSFEHAVVTRTGDEYFIENLSAGGTLVNEEKISGRVKLRERDRVQLGAETLFRVEAAPGASKLTRQRKILLAVAGTSILLLMMLLLFDVFGETTVKQNWTRGYGDLTQWVEGEITAGRLPRETISLMQDGWHAEKVQDRAAALRNWRNLQVLLATSDPKSHVAENAGYHPKALAKLLDIHTQDPQLDSDEMGAALFEFVDERLKYSQK